MEVGVEAVALQELVPLALGRTSPTEAQERAAEWPNRLFSGRSGDTPPRGAFRGEDCLSIVMTKILEFAGLNIPCSFPATSVLTAIPAGLICAILAALNPSRPASDLQIVSALAYVEFQGRNVKAFQGARGA